MMGMGLDSEHCLSKQKTNVASPNRNFFSSLPIYPHRW